MRIARVIGVVGRLLVLVGLILLFYTTYLLWGTSVETRREQANLAEELRTTAPVATEAQQQAQGEIPPAKPEGTVNAGDPLFEIVIPKIGLRNIVVQGVDSPQLKKGPGHFAESPWPGEKGNVALSGHRTTYGGPFFRLNELAVGDEVLVERAGARYRYRLMQAPFVVDPSRVDVVDNHGRDEITLTTCHPRFSAAQRMIVHAAYQGAERIPSAPPAAGGDQPAAQGSETREFVPRGPTVPRDTMVFGGISILALLAAMALSNRLRQTAVWGTVVIVSATGMWVGVFPQILRLMPPNY
ncbi:MAG TPA: class E sortase [Actinomycetota bacterium]|nr:class E sortase [Actinomycetota bacterium]